MKKFLPVAVAVVALWLAGCRSFECVLPGGAIYRSKTFACRQSIGMVEYGTNGTFRVSNYNLDQVSGIQAIGQIAVQAIQAGTMLANRTNQTVGQPMVYTLNP